MTVQKMTKMAIVAAVYVALTYLLAPISYGDLQFRVSELLVLLVFYKKDYIIPLTIGVFLANIASPLGPIDLVFGTMGTVVGLVGIYVISLFKNKFKYQWTVIFLASLMPVISNGFLVGYELSLVYDIPYLATVLSVAIGEFVVVSILGTIIFSILEKKSTFQKLVVSDEF